MCKWCKIKGTLKETAQQMLPRIIGKTERGEEGCVSLKSTHEMLETQGQGNNAESLKRKGKGLK